MAHGFITLYDKKQSPEDVGYEYYMDLLWRSFFQEVEEDKLGNISKFKIHDLMHDIAIQVTGSESTTIYSKENVIDEKTRHVIWGYVALIIGDSDLIIQSKNDKNISFAMSTRVL